MAGAFEGIRIIDFTQGIAGPMASMLLADHGAEGIKVEPPGGDRLRDHPGYLCWNRNKVVVTLDLRRYEGLRTARELLASADAAVFDAHPGELERLGLDAVTAHASCPGLLHAWLPPYGTVGRWSQLPPDDGLLSAVTGSASTQYSYSGNPVHLVTPQHYYGQAMMAATAIAAGLLERTRTGAGRALVVSGLHGVAAIQGQGAIRTEGMVRLGGLGSRGGVPNYRLYRCADGKWFFLGTLTHAFFLRALDAIGLIDVMAMEGIEGEFTNLLRPELNARVIERLDARFAEKPRDEWLRILAEADVPRGPVGVREEWFREETVAANAMRVALEHPTLGRVELPGVSVKLSETPGSVRTLPRLVSAEELPARPAAPASASLIEERHGRTLPLAGVRVLDVGAFIAGTYAPCVLANLGAEVVKIEPPGGDPFRTYGLAFVAHNRGKRSLALDLKAPEGRELFYDMVRQADLVLDNYRLGVRERLGIDYASLARINPRIMTCSVTGYGPEGPLAADPGFDPLVQARSGMMAAQGGDDEPVFHQIPVNDTATAIMAAFGMIAALFARERTGRGQEVTTCLANQSILCQSGELTWYEGRPPSPLGSLDCVGVSAMQRFYQCADGWIAVAGTEPEHFQQLAAALGHPEWAGRWVAERALEEPRDGPLAGLVAAALAELSRADALDRLLSRGVPAAPALDRTELFIDPWLAANDYLDEYDHPLHGRITGVRSYAAWDGEPGRFPCRAPLAGEHSRELLAEFGFDEARVEKLLAAGIVVQG
jgi:crotonobetainyl-CoA:carnitine CoA-transferase CaiB-like acyl-CoA transferase